MALINDLKIICDRLAPLGWQDVLLHASNGSLDIQQPSAQQLEVALVTDIASVNRTVPGFEDIHTGRVSGIFAGRPAQSILYHALASPNCHPTPDGKPAANLLAYPTLAELEVIENFIYSLVSDRSDLDGTVVAVFAYQYRTADRTPHLRHADLAFSRTGVARVGVGGPNYDASRRGFWIASADGTRGPAVLPARYGVFLARAAKPGAGGTVMGGHGGAADDNFLFPVHKLFEGKECINGSDLSVRFLEFHRNEKLAKVHALPVTQGGLPLPPGFDRHKPPYVRDSSNGGQLCTLEVVGSTSLVVPVPHATLVRTASQDVDGANRIVHFMVPEARKLRGRSTRFESSLEIPGFDDGNAGHMDGRLASEYVNIRHKVDPSRDERQALEDLNLLPDSLFTQVLKKGEYPAAHFIDDTCDGCVEAIVEGLGAGHRNFPAFSLITAPDFFPLADQFEVETDETIGRVEPLAKGRLPVNPTLPRPSNLNGFAFDRGETTMTAVVGGNASGPRATITGKVNRMVSFLPDAASNVFAPGWDTSQSFDALGQFLTSSGLGSPFPEDAKLCAALASFWPAVAPDNGRTFGNEKTFFNQLPMTDEELGFHPRHPVVVSGQVAAGTGWDGEFGPFFEQDAGKNHVNFADIRRSDYVSHALAGQVGAWATADIQSEDLIARHQALQKCEEILEARKREVFPDFFVPDVCLVVFRKVDNWADSVPGTPELAGSGFHLEFAEWSEDSTSKPTDDLTRVRREVHKVHVCQFSFHGVAYKNGANPFVFVP